MMADSTYYDLLIKYFSGNSSPEDMLLISSKIKESDEYKKAFIDFRKTWELTEKSKIISTVDSGLEWNKLKNKIGTKTSSHRIEINSEKNQKGMFAFVKIAAAIVLLAVLSYIIYTKTQTPDTRKLIAQTQNTETKLPDGSVVSMNTNTLIEFPENFDAEKRMIKLEGEAFFNVKPDKKKPFIIDAGPVYAEVLGTTFYVNTKGKDGNVEVIVKTGKVAVYNKNTPDQKIIVEPGEQAVFSPVLNKISESISVNENSIAWKTRKLVFTDQKLNDIVSELNKTYNTNIRILNPQIAGCKLTATFEDQELGAVLNILEATLGVEVIQKGAQIQITGQACK